MTLNTYATDLVLAGDARGLDLIELKMESPGYARFLVRGPKGHKGYVEFGATHSLLQVISDLIPVKAGGDKVEPQSRAGAAYADHIR